MRVLLALAGIAVGLVLFGVLYVVLFGFVWMPSGCFRWDPGSNWKPPSYCGALGVLNGVLLLAGFVAAILLPPYLAFRGKR